MGHSQLPHSHSFTSQESGQVNQDALLATNPSSDYQTVTMQVPHSFEMGINLRKRLKSMEIESLREL